LQEHHDDWKSEGSASAGSSSLSAPGLAMTTSGTLTYAAGDDVTANAAAAAGAVTSNEDWWGNIDFAMANSLSGSSSEILGGVASFNALTSDFTSQTGDAVGIAASLADASGYAKIYKKKMEDPLPIEDDDWHHDDDWEHHDRKLQEHHDDWKSEGSASAGSFSVSAPGLAMTTSVTSTYAAGDDVTANAGAAAGAETYNEDWWGNIDAATALSGSGSSSEILGGAASFEALTSDFTFQTGDAKGIAASLADAGGYAKIYKHTKHEDPLPEEDDDWHHDDDWEHHDK